MIIIITELLKIQSFKEFEAEDIKIIHMHFYQQKSQIDIWKSLGIEHYKIRRVLRLFKQSLKKRSSSNQAKLGKSQKLTSKHEEFIKNAI